MKQANAQTFLAAFVQFSLMAVLAANLGLTSTGWACMGYGWGGPRVRHCETNILRRIRTPSMFEAGNTQLAAMHPGRMGVTENLGRRGASEQPGRPGAEPDQFMRNPLPPDAPPRPIILEAMLNGRILAPLMLDTGATYTVITRQTAHDLGITSFERLPQQSFLTPGGRVLSPVTTLKSIRVGTAKAQDVAVAIDVDGHLPLGLLGMTFMRHFKVNVDQAQGQVKFERR